MCMTQKKLSSFSPERSCLWENMAEIPINSVILLLVWWFPIISPTFHRFLSQPECVEAYFKHTKNSVKFRKIGYLEVLILCYGVILHSILI